MVYPLKIALNCISFFGVAQSNNLKNYVNGIIAKRGALKGTKITCDVSPLLEITIIFVVSFQTHAFLIIGSPEQFS